MENNSCNMMDIIDDIHQTIDKETQQFGGNRNKNKNKLNGKKRLKSLKNKTIKSNKLWWLRRRGCV